METIEKEVYVLYGYIFDPSHYTVFGVYENLQDAKEKYAELKKYEKYGANIKDKVIKAVMNAEEK